MPGEVVLLAQCRAGFEPEAAEDLARIAGSARADIAVDAPTGRGHAVASIARFDAMTWMRALDRARPIFVRSLSIGVGPFRLYDDTATPGKRPDRVALLQALWTPLRDALPPALRPPYGELRVEMPDTNEGKSLATIARAIEPPLAEALRERKWLVDAEGDGSPRPSTARSRPALHVFFADGATVHLGVSAPPWSSPYVMGIPRLRMPHGAPSRSTLKLAEAFVVFLGDDEPRLLRAGMKAVDLGAAPGGWTWQLAHRGLLVTAVDNGPLKGEVAHDSQVTHLRVDGTSFRPRRPVDWMTCDMALPPSRVAALVARWIAHGDCRRAIFNLKLPMKKRYLEVMRCRRIIEDALRQTPGRYAISLRQLYHDREEVTGYCARRD